MSRGFQYQFHIRESNKSVLLSSVFPFPSLLHTLFRSRSTPTFITPPTPNHSFPFPSIPSHHPPPPVPPLSSHHSFGSSIRLTSHNTSHHLLQTPAPSLSLILHSHTANFRIPITARLYLCTPSHILSWNISDNAFEILLSILLLVTEALADQSKTPILHWLCGYGHDREREG